MTPAQSDQELIGTTRVPWCRDKFVPGPEREHETGQQSGHLDVSGLGVSS